MQGSADLAVLPDAPGAFPGAAAALGAAGLGTIAASVAAMMSGRAAPAVLPVSLVLSGLMAALVLRGLPQHPFPSFGPANAVTALRGAMTAFAAAMVLASGQFLPGAGGPAVWTVLAVAGLALALDGADGWLARRSGMASEFGARFDMEVDAALILVLSAAALMLGKAGPWVLAIGAIRYAFVAAQMAEPRLAAGLPASFRRKAVCVLQVAALCIAALPPVPPALSAPLAALALAALVWSFAVDIRWLLWHGASHG